MSDKVLQVLTYKSAETILSTGGTQSWALDPDRAFKCKYAVCCRNASTRDAEGPEAHGSAFLVGKVSDVVPSTETAGRWLVRFSEYAAVNFGDQWEGRNPVRFYNAEDYDFDFHELDWQPMPVVSAVAPTPSLSRGLTIADAKVALAETFGVDPSAIEIVVRG